MNGNEPKISPGPVTLDMLIVGAGFAGMYMLHRMRGLGLSALVFEAGKGVGGTWYWNRYPGARCDIESMEYSYQFSEDLQQEWVWSERYAAQPEILAYAEHVAERFDLYRDIRFDARIVKAIFDETAHRWRVETGTGAEVSAKYLVMATGCLSSANVPEIEGMERFAGATYHTGQWPHEPVDFTGKNVAVIGTGSSGVQSIPEIARQAKHLTVFQRTANFAVPARNGPLAAEVQAEIKANYRDLRDRAKKTRNGQQYAPNDVSALDASQADREAEFRFRWQRGGLSFTGSFRDLLLDEQANAFAADFVRARIREVVKDPETAERLCPQSILGCKRLCADTGYYETFNRANVTLVDIKATPILRLTSHGIATTECEYKLDALVFATGFDAMTGSLLKVDIKGRSGRTLRDKWREGPKTYLGVASAGFPNLFTITGPGSPSVLTNMLPTIEQHVEWISDLIADAEARSAGTVEALPDAEEAWVAHVNAVADKTLFPTCNSWYLGANIPGKPRVFMPYIGFPQYVEKCDEIARQGYRGFAFGRP
jgi:cation diffusion facilitator CzcD-associated flavoprotein CzcO